MKFSTTSVLTALLWSKSILSSPIPGISNSATPSQVSEERGNKGFQQLPTTRENIHETRSFVLPSLPNEQNSLSNSSHTNGTFPHFTRTTDCFKPTGHPLEHSQKGIHSNNGHANSYNHSNNGHANSYSHSNNGHANSYNHSNNGHANSYNHSNNGHANSYNHSNNGHANSNNGHANSYNHEQLSSVSPETISTKIYSDVSNDASGSNAASSRVSEALEFTTANIPITVSSNSFPTSTQVASSTSVGSTPSSGLFSGEGTYFTPGLGACGGTNSDSDYIVAVSQQLYDANSNNGACGKKIEAYYGDKSVLVEVVDACVGCGYYDLDFSPSAFSQLANEEAGRIDISWKWA